MHSVESLLIQRPDIESKRERHKEKREGASTLRKIKSEQKRKTQIQREKREAADNLNAFSVHLAIQVSGRESARRREIASTRERQK
jgi:hypothetical protein